VVYDKPVTEIIRQRFSCRLYLKERIEEKKRQRLQECISSLHIGPLGTHVRFHMVAATELDQNALKGLGTYGLIKGASGFIVGAAASAERDLEDYGYMMERLILLATDLELGTCWLGGSFTKSSFAGRIAATRDEQVPAVAAIGYVANPEKARNTLIRRLIGADGRLPWETLFFHERFNVPLTREQAGEYGTPLEMMRLGPSASNKQPWRIVKKGKNWHFYLKRTRGYGEGLISNLMKGADLQRVDMGIAMCHFELASRELSLSGKWKIEEPSIDKPHFLMEYTVSWAC
jgi:hypothetical protein